MANSIDIKHEAEISLWIKCNNCSEDIEAEQQGDSIIITPCNNCLNEQYQKGLVDGKELPF